MCWWHYRWHWGGPTTAADSTHRFPGTRKEHEVAWNPQCNRRYFPTAAAIRARAIVALGRAGARAQQSPRPMLAPLNAVEPHVHAFGPKFATIYLFFGGSRRAHQSHNQVGVGTADCCNRAAPEMAAGGRKEPVRGTSGGGDLLLLFLVPCVLQRVRPAHSDLRLALLFPAWKQWTLKRSCTRTVPPARDGGL